MIREGYGKVTEKIYGKSVGTPLVTWHQIHQRNDSLSLTVLIVSLVIFY